MSQVLQPDGKPLYMASGEAYDGAGTLIATGEAVCRYRDGSHLPEGVPKSQYS